MTPHALISSRIALVFSCMSSTYNATLTSDSFRNNNSSHVHSYKQCMECVNKAIDRHSASWPQV